jgi:hypothetical protein
MKYLPVCFALSLAILYIVVGVPPSVFSKVACVVLGLALLYFGSRAKRGIAPASSRDESGMAKGGEGLHRADAEQEGTAGRPRE